MKKQFIVTVLFALFFKFSMLSQTQDVKKANEYFNSHAYAMAIKEYEKAINEGSLNHEILKKLGDAYFINGNYAEASKWFSKLFELSEETIDSEYLYKYALTLKSIDEYDLSDSKMKEFETIKESDLRLIQYLENTDYLEKIKNKDYNYRLKNLSFNSKESEFAPSFYQENLVFSSARDTGLLINYLHEWNNKPFLDLHSAELTEDKDYVYKSQFSKILNTKTHESSITFSKDGKTAYFTRNNSKNGNFSPDKDGLSRLKIYKATLVDGNWSNIQELPFNSDDYSTAHPTLNFDESKLYFASDMKPSFGASDIFEVAINIDGTFGIPKNLGKNINTEGRETFPFISSSDKLYFASDGHPGLGGLDIYKTNLQELGNVENLGNVINSKEDDFSLIIDEKENSGFFASNRVGGKGSDDIYSFIGDPLIDSHLITLKGQVVDIITNAVLPNAKITIYDYMSNSLHETTSDENGSFEFKIQIPEKKYRFIATLEGFDATTIYLITPTNRNEVEDLLMMMEKKNTKNETVVGSDLAKSLKLGSIYFDLNSSYLRQSSYPDLDKVANFMMENPEVNIEVGSHTDSTESDTYNLWLSNRRAKSTVTYLVSKGVNPDKITGVGFGETQLLNKCSNGIICSETEHAVNRRSEFIIIKKD